jgi:hypothetical protein
VSDRDDTERRGREGTSRCRLDAVGAKTRYTDTDTQIHTETDRSDDGDWRAMILGEGREGARRLGMYSKMEYE